MRPLLLVLGLSISLTGPFAGLASLVGPSNVLAQSPQEQLDADQQFKLGLQHYQTGDFQDALHIFEAILPIYRDRTDQRGRLATLNAIAETQIAIGHLDEALEMSEEVLRLSRDAPIPEAEARALSNLANLSVLHGQFEQAFQQAQTAVEISQQLGDRALETFARLSLGTAFSGLNQTDQAVAQFNQAVALSQEIGDRYLQSSALSTLGLLYMNLGNYDAGLQVLDESLQISAAINARLLQLSALNWRGIIQINLGQNDAAQQSLEEALAIATAIESPFARAGILSTMALIDFNRGAYQQAIDLSEQALAQFRELGSSSLIEITIANNIATAYINLGRFEESLQYFQEALRTAQDLNNSYFEAFILNNVSLTYFNLGRFGDAVRSAETALAIYQEANNLPLQGIVLNTLGQLYASLGQDERAIALFEESLTIHRDIGNLNIVASILNNMATLYLNRGQLDTAQSQLEEALTIVRQTHNPLLEALILNQLGLIMQYGPTGNLEEALTYYTQALDILIVLGSSPLAGVLLGNIGGIYLSQGQYDLALQYFQQGLTLAEQTGNLPTKAMALANIGFVYEIEQQPELAIVFFKEAVNVWEQIRTGNQTLSPELQQSYTETIAASYRHLADLLIAQGRLAEAQQVLELLKLEELREFTRTGGVEGGVSQIPLADIEDQILKEFGTVSDFAYELYRCQQAQSATSPPCSDERLGDLENLWDTHLGAFLGAVEEFRKVLRERLAQDILLTTEQLNNTARKIVTSAPGTVLIYPVVLEDRIRLLLAIEAGTSGVAFRDFEVAVDQQQLWETVFELQQRMSATSGGRPVYSVEAVQETASTLYEWLVAPLEPELERQLELRDLDTLHLVFALDRQTRYIPMSVLFDAEQGQYLIERHAVSTILSADLTNVSDRLSQNRDDNRVLAMGVEHSVEGSRPLRFVRSELDVVVQTANPNDTRGTYPGLEFLDDAFSYEALRSNLAGHRILHIATHARFEPSIPFNSFLLSGKGKLNMEQIQQLGNYGMQDIHLVVLSACETARGGPDQSGIEIPGISYYFLGNGVESVAASLWLVNDCSTSLLMQHFYTYLSQGRSKSEALRQAQLALLQSGVSAQDCETRMFEVAPREGAPVSQPSSDGYAHPYYWAPFILIGNGL